jgi:hypothetical protein
MLSSSGELAHVLKPHINAHISKPCGNNRSLMGNKAASLVYPGAPLLLQSSFPLVCTWGFSGAAVIAPPPLTKIKGSKHDIIR